MRKKMGIAASIAGLAVLTAAPASAETGKFDDSFSATADCGGVPVDYTRSVWGTYVTNTMPNGGVRYHGSGHVTTVWTNTVTGDVVTSKEDISYNSTSTVDENGQVQVDSVPGSARFFDSDGRLIAVTAGISRFVTVYDSDGRWVSSDIDFNGTRDFDDICELVG